MSKRFVITGLGLICAAGNDVNSCWDSLCKGVNGIRTVESFSTEGCSSHVGGEVRCEELPAPEYDRSVRLCLHAAREAIANAGLTDLNEAGVILGSCVGGAASIDHYYTGMLEGTPDAADILKMSASSIACNVAHVLGAGGETANIVNACAAGTMSISYACERIRAGHGQVYLAGGTDAFSSLAYAGFNALHALSAESCRPLNHSDGISLGEGAGIVVVEEYEHAVARGAKIYCEVAGWGVSSDAFHITAPHPQGEGQQAAIRRAMEQADIAPAAIDYVNTHGTGTAKNDAAEFLSLKTLFEGASPSISSTKSMTGHCLGAAGAIEAVISVKALETQTVPPTIGYTKEDVAALPEKAAQLDCVINTARPKAMHNIMSNSFAFGGTNASIIFADSAHPKAAPERLPICITGIGTLCGQKVEMVHNDFVSRGIGLGVYRKLDRFSQMQLISGVDALKDADFTIDADNGPTVGSTIGTADGPMAEITNFQKLVCEKGTAAGSAFSFPNTVYNAAGGHLSIFTKLKGFCATIANGAQAGLQSVCCACDMLRAGNVKTMLASGTDETSDNIQELYSRLGSETILTEGSVTMVLETVEAAKARGAKVYAQVLGYATCHMPKAYGTATDTDLLAKALDSACADAGLNAVERVFMPNPGENGRAAAAAMALVEAARAIEAGECDTAAAVCGGLSAAATAVILGRVEA